MGCSSSKEVIATTKGDGPQKKLETPQSEKEGFEGALTKDPAIASGIPSGGIGSGSSGGGGGDGIPSAPPEENHAALFEILIQAQKKSDLIGFWSHIGNASARAATYRSPNNASSVLHQACRLVDLQDGAGNDNTSPKSVVAAIRSLIAQDPDAVGMEDSAGNLPLHYVLCPASHTITPRYRTRAEVLRSLISADFESSTDYFSKSNVIFHTQTGGVTALYHVLQTVVDDFANPGPTVEYVSVIQESNPRMVGVSNESDMDKPLALLYRRFTRQFDLSEKFFDGDNSRPEVVQHRRQYKMAARNTWKIIELLLQPDTSQHTRWHIVHRAIQVETPPDLLRYIVETNSEELTQADQTGNLPLHYAAKSTPTESKFPVFYTKYVVDELLYKFPEAAGMPDGEGKFPLALAVGSGKQWIGGGVKSLYDAHPEALKQIDLDAHASLKKVLSFVDDQTADDEDTVRESDIPEGVVKDEHHDAIMMVQEDDVDILEVVSAMWAHEEDAGVQMLGCMAVKRLTSKVKTRRDVLRIALPSVAAVVNAMKAHPNEPIVQDKACLALRGLASIDGEREVSFVASGAIAAIVGAMQAHVADAAVQEEACAAIADIVSYGGAERATIVASVSGLTAIVNAIAAHQNVEGVQKEGLRALAVLTEHPNANVPALPQSQTESLLDNARKNFPQSCGEYAGMLLSRLN